MKKYFGLFIILGLIWGTADINRDVYYVYGDEFPLVIEFEKLREAEETSLLPTTVFEECPGGVCPIR